MKRAARSKSVCAELFKVALTHGQSVLVMKVTAEGEGRIKKKKRSQTYSRAKGKRVQRIMECLKSAIRGRPPLPRRSSSEWIGMFC